MKVASIGDTLKQPWVFFKDLVAIVVGNQLIMGKDAAVLKS